MSDAAPKPEDLTGRSRLARNVAFAWGGHLVHVAAGFIMPRLISDRLGQATLGTWDFCWSLVGYFDLIQLGLGGSVQRYVPLYRARGDMIGLSRSVSTVGLFLTLAGWLVVGVAAASALWIAPLFQAKLGPSLREAQWAVFILGLHIAISLMFTVYGGVIVGCHRWDIQNTITAAVYGVSTIAMILALALGADLAGLALAHCLAFSFGDVARWHLARRVCPELVVDYRRACWKTWLEQARFSAKGLIPSLANLLSGQSLSLLIAGFLGPAALAIYSRPRNLVSHVHTLAARYGFILIPTAASLQAQADGVELRQTFRQTTFFLSCLFMPALVALAVFGDSVIRFWMGSAYVFPGLMLVLALGAIPGCIQEPVWSMLTGLNQHGRVALARLAGALCSALLLGLGLGVFHCGLLGAALAFALPRVVVDGLVTPVIACRRLGVPLRHYFRDTYARPLLGVIPFTGVLVLAEMMRPRSLGGAVALTGLAVGILAATYWKIILPARFKQKLVARLFPPWSEFSNNK